MEVVNSITSAASKAIWGEPAHDSTATDATTSATTPETQGTEPLSGVLGDTKKGEPYDKGNLDSTSTEHTIPSTEHHQTSTSSSDLPSKTIAETHIAPLSSTDNLAGDSTSSFKLTSEKPLISERINPNHPSNTSTDATANREINPSTSTTLPIRSEHQTGKTGVTDLHNPTLGSQTKDIKPSDSVNAGAPEGENPAIAAAKKETADAAIDVSGPGPRSLEEIARENGGTAPSATSTSKPSSTANHQGVTTDLKPKPLQEQGEVQTGKGNAEGEHYVKSSGLQAQGGDFDATKPGAGREADRLLGKDGKTVKRDEPGTAVVDRASTDKTGRKSLSADGEETEGKKEGKLSHLKEKIKEKLHKH